MPAATLLLVGAGLAVAAMPGAEAALEYVRATAPHEPWRLLTAQLAHWSPAMLAGDLLLLGVAGSILERRSPCLARAAMLLGVVFTAAALPLVFSLARYRGSSGIGVAVLTAAALDLLLRARGAAPRIVAAAALLVLGAKIAFELLSVAPRATHLPPGVVAVPAVHLAGLLGGVLAVVVVGRRAARAVERT